MSKKIEMSLAEIKAGLGQMEKWARLLRDAVENYDTATGKAVIRKRDDQTIQKKKTNCPPPDGAV